jgi:hypothetical protein
MESRIVIRRDMELLVSGERAFGEDTGWKLATIDEGDDA